jgi:predicted enzyme related to lactoylglutathione lyase
MKNAINWFEIPVTDFERAKKFYSVLTGEQLIDHPMPDDSMKYGVFPYETGAAGIGGAIVQGEGFVPSKEGSTIYLNGGEDLKIPLSRIE